MILDIFILPMLVIFSQNTYKFIDNYVKKCLLELLMYLSYLRSISIENDPFKYI